MDILHFPSKYRYYFSRASEYPGLLEQLLFLTFKTIYYLWMLCVKGRYVGGRRAHACLVQVCKSKDKFKGPTLSFENGF